MQSQGGVMKLNFIKPVLALSICALLMSSCAEKDAGTNPPTNQKPAEPVVSFKGPTTTASNIGVNMVTSQISVFTGLMSGITAIGNPADGVKSGNIWTYSFSSGGTTWQYKTVTDALNNVTWTLTMNGVYESKPVVNWVMWEVMASADNKNGYYKFFPANSTTPLLHYTWETNANGIQSVVMNTWDNAGVKTGVTKLWANPDNSGKMEMQYKKSSSVDLYIAMEVLWSANGSGSYKTWGEDGTLATDQTWTN